MSSQVDHPDHYNTCSFECIDVMEEVFGVEAVQTFCMLNAFKYLWRANHKNGMEDIDKAAWYLNTMLSLEQEKDYDQEPEDEEQEPEKVNTDSISDLVKTAFRSIDKALKNYADMKDPDQEYQKRYRYFKELRNAEYDDEVAFFFAAFKDLPKEENDEQ